MSTINQNYTNHNISLKSSGRWTKDEHQKFLEGLKKFGKNWKQVEDYVGTRNGAQIRSHAQKFFNRLEKEYNVIVDNKTQTKKPNKETSRKFSNDSLPTYNSSQENNSDDNKSFDFTKDNEGYPLNQKKTFHYEFDHNVPKNKESLNTMPKSTIDNMTIFCIEENNNNDPDFKNVEFVNKTNGISHSYSFYDIMMSKIIPVNNNNHQQFNISISKLSDLVTLNITKKHANFMPNLIKTSQNSFKIPSKLTHDNTLDRKLQILRRKGIMFDNHEIDMITKKKVKLAQLVFGSTRTHLFYNDYCFFLLAF